MIDPEAYLTDYPQRWQSRRLDDDVVDWVTGCECTVCQQRKQNNTTWEGKPRVRPQFLSYESVSKAWKQTKDLSWHIKLLCPKKVPAYVFQTRNWGEKPRIPGLHFKKRES